MISSPIPSRMGVTFTQYNTSLAVGLGDVIRMRLDHFYEYFSPECLLSHVRFNDLGG
jgi:hypothetical protein